MLISDFLKWLKEFFANYTNNFPPIKIPQLLGMKSRKLFSMPTMNSHWFIGHLESPLKVILRRILMGKREPRKEKMVMLTIKVLLEHFSFWIFKVIDASLSYFSCNLFSVNELLDANEITNSCKHLSNEYNRGQHSQSTKESSSNAKKMVGHDG